MQGEVVLRGQESKWRALQCDRRVKEKHQGVTHNWMTLGAQKGKRMARWHAKRKLENSEAHQKAQGKV